MTVVRIKNKYIYEKDVIERYQNNMYNNNYVYALAYSACIDYYKEHQDIYEDALHFINNFYDNASMYLMRNASVYYYKYIQLLYEITQNYENVYLLYDILLTLKHNTFFATSLIKRNGSFEEVYDVKNIISKTKLYVKNKKIKDKTLKDFIDIHYYYAETGNFVMLDFSIDVLEEIKNIINETKRVS